MPYFTNDDYLLLWSRIVEEEADGGKERYHRSCGGAQCKLSGSPLTRVGGKVAVTSRGSHLSALFYHLLSVS